MRIPVEVATVTDAVLRRDTENRSILWLELHMKTRRDPADHIYFFKPAPKDRQFVLRASHIHEGGCKWAIRFDDLSDGRKALANVLRSYKLPENSALDQTKS